MYLSDIENTCSMQELTDINEVTITNKNDNFRDFIHSNCNNNTKAIIYNSTFIKSSKQYKNLVKLGFEPVFTYKGNSNNRTVTTFLLDLKKNKYKTK